MKLSVPMTVAVGALSIAAPTVPVLVRSVEPTISEYRPSITRQGSGSGSFVTSWTNMVHSIRQAGIVASCDGHPIAPVASQMAHAFAAQIDVPGAPRPAISDNEEGGMVFYWVAGRREIQVEIDGDSSYFVRVISSAGAIAFVEEGLGSPPADPVRAALVEWRDALGRGPIRPVNTP